MRVGSDMSLYAVARSKIQKLPLSDQNSLAAMPPAEAPEIRSDVQLVSDFYARLTRQQLDWADKNQDQKLTKDEYMAGQARLAASDHRVFDPGRAEDHWSKLDRDGKGWIDESDLANGYQALLPVSVGHLDADYAERLRIRGSAGSTDRR